MINLFVYIASFHLDTSHLCTEDAEMVMSLLKKDPSLWYARQERCPYELLCERMAIKHMEDIRIARIKMAQNIKMMKRYRENASVVYRGDLVTVFPRDERDRAAQIRFGMHGVVINEPRYPAYSVEVWTTAGVIVKGVKKQTYLFARDVYQTLPPLAPVCQELRQKQTQVMRGGFERDNEPKRSIREAHALYYNVQLGTKDRCHCRRVENKCGTNQCSCRKRGVKCNPKCKCARNCCNATALPILRVSKCQ